MKPLLVMMMLALAAGASACSQPRRLLGAHCGHMGLRPSTTAVPPEATMRPLRAIARLLGAAALNFDGPRANDFGALHWQRLAKQEEVARNIRDAAAAHDTMRHATSRDSRDSVWELDTLASRPGPPGPQLGVRRLQQAAGLDNSITTALRELGTSASSSVARSEIALAAGGRRPTPAAIRRVQQRAGLDVMVQDLMP